MMTLFIIKNELLLWVTVVAAAALSTAVCP
jgi:hypothetical protein